MQQRSLRICIITDAWHPQVNGVVRTLDTLRHELKARGHKVFMLTPKLFSTMPLPTYPEIKIALNARRRTAAILDRWQVDAIHIATEGPLGWAGRAWCLKHDRPFTTAYHTAFPEYVEARFPVKADWIYPLFRRFHAKSSGVLVATQTVRTLLSDKGFGNIVEWTRGVDTNQFHPDLRGSQSEMQGMEGPVQLYVGRVAVEKNIEAFLKSQVPGTKVVVGDGPALKKLQADYPDVRFLGPKFGEDLAAAYASADVFVFPSKTDTFGLVMIEALACGTPVAAYPVQGPLDVVGADGTGPFEDWTTPIAALDADLDTAIRSALTCDRDAAASFARLYSWQAVTDQFLAALAA
ncbi:glycosyltransferase family 4 protein [Kordiimonas marina]|uniref:glycosyltransferase family 4 protein n=1 Tax=Kordiimonas marina TaxID=2872312 RepID=UPI001FF38329|nr:glycosyltransferase family 1 protein [Kordiimonas marina]MCJ9428607.1 glycosyltransferase family 1 protein [Kordiimonas marina]